MTRSEAPAGGAGTAGKLLRRQRASFSVVRFGTDASRFSTMLPAAGTPAMQMSSSLASARHAVKDCSVLYVTALHRTCITSSVPHSH